FEEWRAHPLLGVGAGAYKVGVAPLLGFTKPDAQFLAHNTLLSILVETVVVGFLLFAVFLWRIARDAWMLPGPLARGWLAALAVWAIGTSAATWEDHKATWFLFSVLLCQAATFAASASRARIAVPARAQLHSAAVWFGAR
ncbi:MAG: hypothetical protein ACRD5L_05715, partial [Bryobacteraceae bacterium]